jgi:hypothetical protein
VHARRLILAVLTSSCLFALGTSSAAFAAPPTVEETAVLDVAATSATLTASVDPQGNETSYRFEYGTSEAYGSSIPVPDGAVGSGSSPIAVSSHVQGLAPSTTYHYRVVALVSSRGETVAGADGSFTTQSAGGELALPDGRQWELVTPPDKRGALVQSLSRLGPIQAAEDGGAITYGTNVPIEAEPPGYGQPGGQFAQTLSTRGAQGWSSRDIAAPHTAEASPWGPDEYELFSGDLSVGLIYPQGMDYQENKTFLSSKASELTPYVRRNALCDNAATVSECYLPILTGKEGFADVPPGTGFGRVPGGVREDMVSFEGASSDFGQVVLGSAVALTSTPLPVGGIPAGEVYEWSAGHPPSEALQLVSVLPASEGGGLVPNRSAGIGVEPGGAGAGGRHAVSGDGSRIFWSFFGEDNRLYVRDTEKEETVRLDMQQPGVPVGGTPDGTFQIASSDGSKVFFTDGDNLQRLMPQSGATGQDLYECELIEEGGHLACRISDLTPEVEGKSSEVQGYVLGASEDGAYVYFVANGVLGNAAKAGATQGTCKEATNAATCNLYEYHDGEITFIAALSGGDESDWSGYANGGILSSLTTRVSPDGRFLAFMSERPLTGYDNRDASSGRRDMEVYLYDAATARLACVSCNPTGGRPAGFLYAEFSSSGNAAAVVGRHFSEELSIAANLPAGNQLARVDTMYQPRALDDSGRVFFNSSDALVPQDINDQEDVYEFEPDGVGSCSSTGPTFSQKTGGCITLISSGLSPEESGFMDASVTGSDVFFVTSSRLTPQDYDTAYDLYDAHECSTAAPCVSAPVSAPPCESGDACKAAPSPQPAIFGAPPSATFAGAGNLAAPAGTPRVAPRALTRAQKLARALRACGKKKLRRTRVVCERQARRRYRSQPRRKAGITTSKGGR